MREKEKPKEEENPEFENVKAAFRQILAVPKSKIDKIENRQSKPAKKLKDIDEK